MSLEDGGGPCALTGLRQLTVEEFHVTTAVFSLPHGRLGRLPH